MSRLPLIGVTACTQQTGSHACHIRADKHIRAEAVVAKVLRLILPTPTAPVDPSDTLWVVDGLRFNASPSNVEFSHCSGPVRVSSAVHDPARDRSTLTLVGATVAEVQRLGIFCEFREMSAASGGGLQPKVHQTEAFLDRREPEYPSVAGQYAARHPVHVAPGTVGPGLASSEDIRVNSFRGQGIERLTSGLRVKASAADSLSEASSVATGSALASTDEVARGVQWHPEWQVARNSDYLVIFQAFADACRKWAARHDVHASR